VGLAVGALVTFLVAERSRPVAKEVAATPQATAQAPTPTPESTTRRVVLPLPFLADHVVLDDLERDLVPAADVGVFDLPREAGLVHRVVVTALDGTRAEGFVRETDGVARPDEGGFTIAGVPTLQPVGPKATPPRPAPIGTVRNGFTKLR
jgi:hypothetical protein